MLGSSVLPRMSCPARLKQPATSVHSSSATPFNGVSGRCRISSKARGQLQSTAAQAEVMLDQSVVVGVENTSWNSRKLHASVNINAPVDLVWGRLTDYEALGTFIPSLVENRMLRKTKTGALLYQVGAQDVAMGVKFSAACTLECTEWPAGVPEELTSTSGDGSDGLLPYPRDGTPGVPARDISFTTVKGDFKAFRGIWRLQPGPSGTSSSTRLCYSLFVKPQSWLPVALISSRIEKEVLRNLNAVREHAEDVRMISAELSSVMS